MPSQNSAIPGVIWSLQEKISERRSAPAVSEKYIALLRWWGIRREVNHAFAERVACRSDEPCQEIVRAVIDESVESITAG